jgi:predicted transcriptional regulator
MTRMWVRGHSQREIAKKFGITQPQVCHDLKEIRERLLPEDTQQMKEARKDRLMELAMFKQEFLDEWERSKRDKETQTQEKISTTGKGKKGEDGERIKAALRTEGRCGNPAFLNGALKVVQEECKIADLYPSKKMDLGNKEGKPLQIQFIEVGDAAPREKAAPSQPTTIEESVEMSKQERPPEPKQEPPKQPEYVPPKGGLEFVVVCAQEDLQNALSEFAEEVGEFHKNRPQSKMRGW